MHTLAENARLCESLVRIIQVMTTVYTAVHCPMRYLTRLTRLLMDDK